MTSVYCTCSTVTRCFVSWYHQHWALTATHTVGCSLDMAVSAFQWCWYSLHLPAGWQPGFAHLRDWPCQWQVMHTHTILDIIGNNFIQIYEHSQSANCATAAALSPCAEWVCIVSYKKPYLLRLLQCRPLVTSSLAHAHHVWPTYTQELCGDLVIPRTRRLGNRAFSVAAPAAWNSLPPDIYTPSTLCTFKNLLKTHLFFHSFQLST